MRTTFLNNLPITEFNNFLSSSESDALLQERLNGFQSALSHYPLYYRNNDRLVEDNTPLAQFLFEKLETVAIASLDQMTGINDRLRFCRYQKGQLFSKHQDGVHYLNEVHASKYTFLLYLNDPDDFSGGTTEFFKSKYDETPDLVIKPMKGKLVLFDHRIWHKGAKIISGNKYILRTDIYVDRQEHTYQHDGYIWSLMQVDENHFFSCGRDASIKLWNLALQCVKTMHIHSKSVVKMARLNENEFVSCSRDFTIKKWSYSGKVLATIYLKEMILDMVVNAAEKQLIAVGTSGTIFLLNSELVVQKTIKAHTHWIWAVALIDKDVVSCGEDGRVVLTNLLTGTTKCVLKQEEAFFSIYTDGTSIFVGTKSGMIIHFSLITHKRRNLALHLDIVRSITIYQNELFTCSEDNKIMRHAFSNGHTEEIRASDNFIQDILILNGQLYAAGFDGRITIDKIQ